MEDGLIKVVGWRKDEKKRNTFFFRRNCSDSAGYDEYMGKKPIALPLSPLVLFPNYQYTTCPLSVSTASYRACPSRTSTATFNSRS